MKEESGALIVVTKVTTHFTMHVQFTII